MYKKKELFCQSSHYKVDVIKYNSVKRCLCADPGPPVFLAGERVGSAGILLSWNTPPHPNGRIISYIVKYKEVCPWLQNTYTQVTTKPDSLEVLLTNLNPGTTYEIQVTFLILLITCKM